MLRVLPNRAEELSARKRGPKDIDNNDFRSLSNVVMCCGACNSSKGTKSLTVWFQSEYCQRKNISAKTVSAVVKNWLRQQKISQRLDAPTRGARHRI